MFSLRRNQAGIGMVGIFLGVLILGAVAGGIVILKSNDQKVGQPVASHDEYPGWQTATSPRAKFAIRYPADWTYSETVGSKDYVEHITLSGAKFVINIDSYNGQDPATGGIAGGGCSDCKATLQKRSFTAGQRGKLNLETITYSLDQGLGNALVLRQANGTYYIPSVEDKNVTTSFRGISVLDSLQAYQSETPQQFRLNPEFTTAQKILKSVAY